VGEHLCPESRQLTERTLLYTEMVVADDLLKKDTEGRALLLDSSAEEFPGLTLQLGGADPATLAAATQVEKAPHMRWCRWRIKALAVEPCSVASC